MNVLSRFIKHNLPGPLIESTVWFQLHVAPAPFYRRRAQVLRQAGSPRAVLGGPFKGMVYARHAADKCLVHRLLGTYECELHGAVERMCAEPHDAVVVAGAGEGYYAVGLARRLPLARVHAYEGFRWARHLLKQMIDRNQVRDRVHVGGYVTPDELARTLVDAASPAIVCDVEGFEQQLMDPDAVPGLRRATILLELHDNLVPGVSQTIRERFESTHHLEEFHDRPRSLLDLPAGVSLREDDALWAIDEYRFRGAHQSWMYLYPRQAASVNRAAA